MHAHPTPLYRVITMGPFMKWGIDFTMCHLVFYMGHKYIIVEVDYFTKWVKTMLTFSNDGKTEALLIFNHKIAWFWIPKHIVMDNGSHFQNTMMIEFLTTLGFKQDHSYPSYPQANKEVEEVNKFLKIMLQLIVDKNRSNWQIILFPTLWAYRTSIKIAIGFTPLCYEPNTKIV